MRNGMTPITYPLRFPLFGNPKTVHSQHPGIPYRSSKFWRLHEGRKLGTSHELRRFLGATVEQLAGNAPRGNLRGNHWLDGFVRVIPFLIPYLSDQQDSHQLENQTKPSFASRKDGRKQWGIKPLWAAISVPESHPQKATSSRKGAIQQPRDQRTQEGWQALQLAIVEGGAGA